MNSSRRAYAAVVGALLLVGAIVWLVDGLPRRWNLVLVVWDGPGAEGEVSTPRRAALALEGLSQGYSAEPELDRGALEQWVAPLVAAGWTLHDPQLQGAVPPARAVEANLDAFMAGESPRPLRKRVGPIRDLTVTLLS